MEWLSKNVPKGGIWHQPKIEQNTEKQQFLKTLIDEAKMSMMQRKKINYYLRTGEPFPTARKQAQPKKLSITVRPGSSKRRTLDSIKKLQAFEKSDFVPRPGIDREKEKLKLQDKMAFGQDLIKPKITTVVIPKTKINISPDIDRCDQLIREIQEREAFLAKMDELGEGQNYKSMIENQIEERVREMEKLNLDDD